MKANELRIGNLIQKGNEPERVTIIRENGTIETEVFPYEEDEDCLSRVIEDMEGIPIAEEWLLKFGFVCDDFYNSFALLIKGRMILTYYKGDPSSFSIFQDKKSLDFRSGAVKYVHQLQNLYFVLTGEELIEKKKRI